MLGYALMGALIAGLYGVVHDQITYSMSPEYFTRVKFFQFHYADFGLPPRSFVAEIGFLATWWVGLIAGWFLGARRRPGGRTGPKRAPAAAGVLRSFRHVLSPRRSWALAWGCRLVRALISRVAGICLSTWNCGSAELRPGCLHPQRELPGRPDRRGGRPG